MTLFHGSNVKIENIDLEKCRPYKDFGRGFYLTDIEERASRMAVRTARQYGGFPTVKIFELDEKIYNDENIKIKCFENPNQEWAYFVMNNRDKSFNDNENSIANFDNKFDVVIGAVANDDLTITFNLFAQGYIDIESMIKRLKFRKLTNQYSFHTEKAVKYLEVAGYKFER